jgi:hypothetical protein
MSAPDKTRRPDITADTVYEILRYHQGRLSAIRARQIARLLGGEKDPTSVRVRSAITELIEHRGVPIASTIDQPAGYFVATSVAEREAYAAQLKARIYGIARRLRAFDRAAAERILGQRGLGL